jgi:hypothetical protein
VLYVIFFASCELESEPEEMVVKRTRKSEGTAATSARVRGQGQRVRGLWSDQREGERGNLRIWSSEL